LRCGKWRKFRDIRGWQYFREGYGKNAWEMALYGRAQNQEGWKKITSGRVQRSSALYLEGIP